MIFRLFTEEFCAFLPKKGDKFQDDGARRFASQDCAPFLRHFCKSGKKSNLFFVDNLVVFLQISFIALDIRISITLLDLQR